MALTQEQQKALRALAEAYENLSGVWMDEWEDAFGGNLARLGVLPTISLDEAGATIRHLLAPEEDEELVLWRCPKGCPVDHVLVCGGEGEDEEGGNLLFQMTLTGEYTRYFADGTYGVPDACHVHAGGSCGFEPICPHCSEPCLMIGSQDCKGA